ncbi:putative colicin V production protein [Pediococcus damnosus]|uniref:Colicin V production protein n=1 Tax=Pediococcus damnosus TaxID=51663 RepID=A0A0R2HM90_9LACO|nr:CvpA family protein [Pediococcus damnosus]AMV60554.1 putative colicin V production protein [Pediococcus damnosus]AMV62985.1 putative colicin V production protein [Pediococcus damnosus]AMV64869.1 putative colicin V production protein [Pediococcus damnosus]AMV67129.1 putative colicin V production protein [Pediococcus damnosus]AMV69268.1 putative colicin V production protein [Pediococcus damnosus]
MLLSIIIIAILLWKFTSGLHKGFVVELLYTIGYFAVFIFAKVLCGPVASLLSTSFSNNQSSAGNTAVMSSVSFIILMAIGWLLVRLIARWSRLITWIPVIKQVNGLAGGIVSIIIAYFVIFILLSVSQFLPNDAYQAQLSDSPVAQFIVKKTPGISSDILNKYILNTDETTNTNTISNEEN